MKPNIIVILADDLGWNAVGYRNDEVTTPNIDQRIVGEGVEFDHFYSCPMCSPARAGLMTGRYPIRFGCARSVIPPWRMQGVPTDEVFMPEVPARAGYEERALIGKWHLGHNKRKWLPLEREGELDWHRGYETCQGQGYSTDLIADETVAFIRRHADSDAPFYCYTAFNAPHCPFQAPQH